ncbi:MAG: hypothetical protein ABIW77_00250 [Gelidibacter sp.]
MNTTTQALYPKELFVETRQHEVFGIDEIVKSHAQMYKKKGLIK